MKNASKVKWVLSIVLLVVLSSCVTQRPRVHTTSPQGDLAKAEQARVEEKRIEREKVVIDFVSAQQRYPQMDEGLRLEKEGKLEEALGIYRKVASEMPRFADVYARMAYTLRKMEFARQSGEMLHKCEEIGGFKQDSPYAMDAHFVGPWLMTDSMVVKAPTDERELLKTVSPANALMYSSGGYWILIMAKEGDCVPIVNNEPTVGVGSELRFDRGDWLSFLGKQYRKGGVRVLKTGIEFLEGTEQLDNGDVKVFASGKWTKQVIELKPPSEETLTGEIEKIDTNGNLVVSIQTAPDTSQQVSIILNDETTITLDGKMAKAVDLHTGQTVTVRCTAENRVAIVSNVPTGEVVLRTAKSVSAVSPSPQTETASPEKTADLSTAAPFREQDVAGVVDPLIAALLNEQLSYTASLNKHHLAPRLRDSLKRFGTVFCLLSNKLWIIYGNDEIALTTDEEWAPLSCGASGGERTFPKVELGKGELGLRRLDTKYVDAYAKEGTQVRINGQIFTYHGGRWKKQ